MGLHYLPALALSSELCSLNPIWFFCHKNTGVRAQEEHDGLLPHVPPGCRTQVCSAGALRGVDLLPLSASLCCFSSTSSRGRRRLGKADAPVGFRHSGSQVRAGAKQESGASLCPAHGSSRSAHTRCNGRGVPAPLSCRTLGSARASLAGKRGQSLALAPCDSGARATSLLESLLARGGFGSSFLTGTLRKQHLTVGVCLFVFPSLEVTAQSAAPGQPEGK